MSKISGKINLHEIKPFIDILSKFKTETIQFKINGNCIKFLQIENSGEFLFMYLTTFCEIIDFTSTNDLAYSICFFKYRYFCRRIFKPINIYL